MGGMTPMVPISPICLPGAEVPGNIPWPQWDGMSKMRGMGNMPPMLPLSPMPPICLPGAEVLGNIKALP